MSKKQPKNPRELTPLTPKSVQEIARQLGYFAQQYEQVANEMQKSEIASIELKGAANLMLTIDRINGAVQSLQSGLKRARTRSLISPTQQAVTAEVDADGDKAQQKPRRKGASRS